MSTCAIVSQNTEMQCTVAAAVQSLGINTTIFSSVPDLVQFARETRISGILFELATFLRSSPAEKSMVQELTEIYPCAKFKLIDDTIIIPCKDLKQFVAECRRFQPRTLRKSSRVVKHLSVYLSTNAGFEQAEQSITINMSDDGYFIYSSRAWSLGDRVWVKFVENDKIISGVVRCWRPWGKDKDVPGVGIDVSS